MHTLSRTIFLLLALLQLDTCHSAGRGLFPNDRSTRVRAHQHGPLPSHVTSQTYGAHHLRHLAADDKASSAGTTGSSSSESSGGATDQQQQGGSTGNSNGIEDSVEQDNGFSTVGQTGTSSGDDIIPIVTGGDIEDSVEQNNGFSTVGQTGTSSGDDIIVITGGGAGNSEDTVGAQVRLFEV